MKKILIIIAFLLMAMEAFGQSAKDLYNKYSDLNGVSAVYVSPAMFRMIGKLPEMDMEAKDGGKVDLTPVVKNLSGFYLLDVDNTQVAGKLFTEVKRMLDSKKFELLFEAKNDGEITRLFTSGSDKTVSALILTTRDAESFTFMSLEGNMDREQLENILAESAK